MLHPRQPADHHEIGVHRPRDAVPGGVRNRDTVVASGLSLAAAIELVHEGCAFATPARITRTMR
jgi:hypothetical protein